MFRQLCVVAGFGLALQAMAADPEPAETTLLQLMLEVVVPASDVLWGAEDPASDEEWQVLDDAAARLIAAFETARRGGLGPNDAQWASEAKFQAYLDSDVAAANAARAAIAARDMDALFQAGDALYEPCESCHIDYNPRVEGTAE